MLDLNLGNILFCGTFDPPHSGHIHCIAQVQRLFPHAQFGIVPAFHPKRSKNTDKQPQAPYKHRFEMTKLAFKSIEKTHVLDLEQKLQLSGYSIETITAFRNLYQIDSQIGFIIGQDQFEKFATWKQPAQILQQAILVVLKRDPSDRSMTNLCIETLYSWDFLSISDVSLVQNNNLSLIEVQADGFTFHVVIPEITAHEASSTVIRRACASLNQDQDSQTNHWLDCAVNQYIKTHSLYQ